MRADVGLGAGLHILQAAASSASTSSKIQSYFDWLCQRFLIAHLMACDLLTVPNNSAIILLYTAHLRQEDRPPLINPYPYDSYAAKCRFQ